MGVLAYFYKLPGIFKSVPRVKIIPEEVRCVLHLEKRKGTFCHASQTLW